MGSKYYGLLMADNQEDLDTVAVVAGIAKSMKAKGYILRSNGRRMSMVAELHAGGRHQIFTTYEEGYSTGEHDYSNNTFFRGEYQGVPAFKEVQSVCNSLNLPWVSMVALDRLKLASITQILEGINISEPVDVIIVDKMSKFVSEIAKRVGAKIVNLSDKDLLSRYKKKYL